jgi:predicted acetyltransferase
MEIETIDAGELDDVLAALAAAFLEDVDDEEVALDKEVLEPERTLVVRDGGRIVASAGVVARELTVPGGPVPVAGVTIVGVAPSHRRRGVLSALMRRQLADVHDAGEAVAALWASEAVIYGRFGYGMATQQATLEVRTREARLRPDVERLERAPEIILAADAAERLVAAYEAVRTQRPGMLSRSPAWWAAQLFDPEKERDGAGRLRAAVLGEDQGYALYAYKEAWGEGGAAGELRIRELVAGRPVAAAALWGFLLELDLVRHASWDLAPADEPLPHMLDNSRAVTARVGDALWVRLVDAPRALRERTYSAPFDVVIELADELCPWNAGRYRVAWDGTTAECEPTSADAQLELSAAELGAVHLGGTTLLSLARAGRLRSHDRAALWAASTGFRGALEPWCPEIF